MLPQYSDQICTTPGSNSSYDTRRKNKDTGLGATSEPWDSNPPHNFSSLAPTGRFTSPTNFPAGYTHVPNEYYPGIDSMPRTGSMEGKADYYTKYLAQFGREPKSLEPDQVFAASLRAAYINEDGEIEEEWVDDINDQY